MRLLCQEVLAAGAGAGRLAIETIYFPDLSALPAAGLVYAGYPR